MDKSAVTDTEGTGRAKRRRWRADLRLRRTLTSWMHMVLGLAGGALVSYMMVLDGEELFALPGLVLIAYGASTMGSVTVKDGVIRRRAFLKKTEIPVGEIREFGLGKRNVPPSSVWFPVVDTVDGDSIVFNSLMSVSKQRSFDRAKRLRSALGVEGVRTVDRLAGTKFRPKQVRDLEAPKPKLSGYELYLHQKAADEAAAALAPPEEVIELDPQPEPSPEPIGLGFTSVDSGFTLDPDEPAPEVFVPRPLSTEKPTLRRRQPDATPPATQQSPEPQRSGITSLFGGAPAAAKPAALQSLFGSVPAEKAPLTSLFGSSGDEDNSDLLEWSRAV